MRLLLAALLLASCGASVGPRQASVGVGEDARVIDLVGALSRTLRERGHEGECFLAWDAPEPDVTVRIGERSRSAALSCGGLDGLSEELEGRCPAARIAWATPGRPAAVTYVFGAPGDAFAQAPVAIASADRPAAEALFFAVEGGRVVFALDLARSVAGKPGAKKQEDTAGATPLEEPATQLAMRQLVARVQRCNPSGEGSLVLEWRALPDGTVTEVRPLASNVGGEVVQCAIDQARASSFPERDAPIDYCAPVLLAPSLRPR